MLAYDYPLLGLFWTMLWFFLWIAWLIALFQIIGDIFNSDDLGGWGKAIWLIFVLIRPLLGVLIYLIARGSGMRERSLAEAQEAQKEFDTYVRQTAGSGSAADELAKLSKLHDEKKLSDEEFERAKAKIVG